MPTKLQIEDALIKADAAGNTEDAKRLANALKSMDNPSALDFAGSAAAGVNELVPAIAGLPMDAMTNVANLGIAGYGTARGLTGGGSENMPELLPPQIGGSQWIKEQMKGGAKAIGVPHPFGSPETETPAQQNLRLGGTIVGAGVLAPASGAKQAAMSMLKMTPSAGGAIVAKEAFPDQPLAPIAGMMAGPGALVAAQKTGAALKTPVNQAFMKAHKLGYKVPPVLAKPSKTQQALEGTAGPVPTKQKASIYNQKVTNDLIKREIGYHKDTPLSPEGLQAIRNQAGQVYEQAKGLGTFTADKAFKTEVAKIASQGKAMSAEFPALVKKDVAKLAKSFAGKKTVSAEATIEAVKQLRADSSAGFKSQDPSIVAMARAKGKLANALEGLMERNIAAKDSAGFLETFKTARQNIAKTYTIEKALKGENVDAVSLGRQLDKGKPLSGAIRDVAEFGQNFKGAAQVNPPQQTNFRPMDVLTGGGAAVATGNPTYLALAGARPALRAGILSKPYQAMLARTRPADLNRIMNLPKEAQTAAIAALLADINNQESLAGAPQ